MLHCSRSSPTVRLPGLSLHGVEKVWPVQLPGSVPWPAKHRSGLEQEQIVVLRCRLLQLWNETLWFEMGSTVPVNMRASQRHCSAQFLRWQKAVNPGCYTECHRKFEGQRTATSMPLPHTFLLNVVQPLSSKPYRFSAHVLPFCRIVFRFAMFSSSLCIVVSPAVVTAVILATVVDAIMLTV